MRSRQQRRRPAAALVAALALVGTVAPGGAQAADETPNLVRNGDFATAVSNEWWGITQADVVDGELCLDVPAVERFGNFVNLGLEAGESYVFGFTARGDTGGLIARVQADGASGPEGYDVEETFAATAEATDYEWGFTATGGAQRVQFELSGASPAGTACISSVYVQPVAEVLTNPTFDGLAPWWTTSNLALAQADGRMCGVVPAGGNQWDVILGQGGIALEAGKSYTIKVTASAGPEASARVLIPRPGTDWPPLYFADITLRADGQTFSQTFEAEIDADTQVQLQLGGNAEPFEVCLDLVSLTTGGTVEEFEHETGPRVRVNQVGYLPDGPKRATLVTDATEPVEWALMSGDTVRASGMSVPAGLDESAGLNVHTIDFSDVVAPAADLRLAADGEVSYPFRIAPDVYDDLRADSLGMYYTQRSGFEIVPVEVDAELLKEEYARPAGHVSAPGGGDVNQGDVSIPCFPAAEADVHHGANGWRCPEGYTIDASGGWYDAGDHGKYVVNSGISVYQLLSTYERSLHAGVVEEGALADGSLVIPERDNDVPDVLDEVRWNLEWMLRMQVADGVEMVIDGEEVDAGGLVHHKVHDIDWTGLNTLPHEDPMARYVHRPSTAATLNLAAAAAQGSRLYGEYDAAFATELLDAAERAWDAASAHPAIYAADSNSLDPNPGGGPYNDRNVGDEVYWAAAQLFLATGDAEYRDAVLASPYHVGGAQGDIWRATGFDWGFTAAAGRLDLATVPNNLPGRAGVIDSVLTGADRYLAVQQGEPFGHAYNPGRYDWGSNHQVINNAVVLATAFDLTGEAPYRAAALETFDYVLGRNAINNSYVKGYGTHFTEHMHSRWLGSADRLPPFPDGHLSGGPNSAIQDPIAQANLQGCAPQACYIDHIDSWSTNETTINWNAPLSWFASWADDMSGGQDWAPPTPTCKVGYTTPGTWPGGFNAQVWVTNLGPGTLDAWELSWDFPAGQTVARAWGATVTQDGATVTAASLPWNSRLDDTDEGAKQSSITWGFTGAGSGDAPSAFTLNGVRCATD
ncbi:glycoside hydrolase family 9 protein [Antribacter gilvus]|uniref:glycoside hydrolase family 9 protein n=1 Tax=Antribacter gilvus TaxID=2304675 RepID=UPI0013DEC4DE|nr:glycoside hydrolase family 9 protein [Antribacter gilvus]